MKPTIESTELPMTEDLPSVPVLVVGIDTKFPDTACAPIVVIRLMLLSRYKKNERYKNQTNANNEDSQTDVSLSRQ
jgi:hypothetical protein